MSLTLSNKAFSQVAQLAISKSEAEGGKFAKANLERGVQDLVELSVASEPTSKLTEAFKELRHCLGDSRHAAMYGALSAVAGLKSITEAELQSSAKRLKGIDVAKVGAWQPIRPRWRSGVNAGDFQDRHLRLTLKLLPTCAGIGCIHRSHLVALDNLFTAPAPTQPREFAPHLNGLAQ